MLPIEWRCKIGFGGNVTSLSWFWIARRSSWEKCIHVPPEILKEVNLSWQPKRHLFNSLGPWQDTVKQGANWRGCVGELWLCQRGVWHIRKKISVFGPNWNYWNFTADVLEIATGSLPVAFVVFSLSESSTESPSGLFSL